MPSLLLCLRRFAAAVIAMQNIGAAVVMALVLVVGLVAPANADAISAACRFVNTGGLNGTTTGSTGGAGENNIPLPASFVGDTFNVQQAYAGGANSAPGNSASAFVNARGQQVIYRSGTVNYSYTAAVGDSPLTFQRAAGNGGQNVTTTTTATCTPAPMNVTIAPPTLPPAMAGVFYSQTLTASGGAAPYSFAVTAGALPPGVTLSQGGTISGTTTALGSYNFTVTATDANGSAGIRPYTLTVNAATSTTAVASSQNPSMFGQAVTFTATVTGTSPTGTVQFKDGGANLGAPVMLAGGSATLTTSALTAGSHSITAVYSGDANNTTSTSPALVQNVNQSATTTAVTSSLNPSAQGQAVTFTATVSSGGGTPTGAVTFQDGGTAIGSGTLAAGMATLTTSTLTLGSHSITAVYGGSASFTASTSAVLVQAVSTPADSLKLRAMQVLAAPVVAQNSGAAISGAIDSAIAEGFADGGTFVTPSGSGIRFNFAADPDAAPPSGAAPRATDPFSSASGAFASGGRGSAAQPSGNTNTTSRVDDAFNALGYAGYTKAPPAPRYAEPRDWLAWAEVRGSVLDHWGAGNGVLGANTTASMLYGSQINLILGLTRRLTPNLLVGVLGGYETFDYRSDALQGHLTGDGWTVGSYLGWKLTQTIRFDAAVAYSGIGYDNTAGTASGNFSGDRWMVSSGLTGSYHGYGFEIEPSARIYALWEHENAYTDSLGTAQAERDFTTGRASVGGKAAYPVAWSSTVVLAPYVGLYADYYFNSDNATALLAQSGLPGAVVLEGYSARATGGIAASFAGGGQVALGAEYSGIGGNAKVAIYRARASVPF